MTAPSDDDAMWAAVIRQFEPPERHWDTPGELAKAITPGTVQTPALDLIDAALVEVMNIPDGRLIITMPPQEGKSTRVAGDFPAWWLTQDPDARIVVASYGQSLATRNGSAIRQRITQNPQLGLTIAPDNGAKHEWTLAGHEGGVFSIGIGGGLTGRPADLMVIDDPIKDPKEANSETFRENNWEWWTKVASTRLAPGAPVVVILTRWHEDDLAGRLLKAVDDENWTLLNIPAEADHRPEKNETDPLGREPGEFMQSARTNKLTGEPRTQAQWERIRKRSLLNGTWHALYQGRPSPPDGLLFKRDGWGDRYTEFQHFQRDDGSCLVPLHDGDELAMSWDMAFKDQASSDYVVGQVWLRRGVEVWLIDMVRRRMSFVDTLDAVKAMTAKWPQASSKFVEDKANGTAVINMLSRSVGGLIPVEPDGGKVARAQAVAPFVAAKNVHLPAAVLLPNVEELVDEGASFPNGQHDDAIDAMTQALNRLLLAPLLLDDTLFEDSTDDDFMISAY